MSSEWRKKAVKKTLEAVLGLSISAATLAGITVGLNSGSVKQGAKATLLLPKAVVDSGARKALSDSFGIFTATARSYYGLSEQVFGEPSNPFRPKNIEELVTSLADYCYAVRRFQNDFGKCAELVQYETKLGEVLKRNDLDLNSNFIWENLGKINAVLVPNGYVFLRTKSKPLGSTEFMLYRILERRNTDLTLFNPKISKEEKMRVPYVLVEDGPLINGYSIAFNLNGVCFIDEGMLRGILEDEFNMIKKAKSDTKHWHTRLVQKEWGEEYKSTSQSKNPKKTFVDLALKRMLQSQLIHETAHNFVGDEELVYVIETAYGATPYISSDCINGGTLRNPFDKFLAQNGVESNKMLELPGNAIQQLARKYLSENH